MIILTNKLLKSLKFQIFFSNKIFFINKANQCANFTCEISDFIIFLCIYFDFNKNYFQSVIGLHILRNMMKIMNFFFK